LHHDIIIKFFMLIIGVSIAEQAERQADGPRSDRSFVQVSAHNSFSRAAEVLQLTQPSITARIQSLERELGEELFERGGRGVLLTDSGRAFLPYAERILQTVAEGRNIIDEVRNVELGSHLGSAFTIPPIPGILALSAAAIAVLTSRSIRAAPSRCWPCPGRRGSGGLVRFCRARLETAPVHDEIVLIVSPDHLRRPHPTAGGIASEPIICSTASSYFGPTHGFFRQVVPNIAMELDSLEATKRMVEEGLGIALVPLVTIERELQVGRLVRIEMVDAPSLKRPVSLIYKRHRKRPRTVQAFIDTLAEMYALNLPVG
jgi:DNA-binding transcriptional LysR family regulator